MAYAYEEALAAYCHAPGLKYLKGSSVTSVKGAYQKFKLAAEVADQCKADYTSFVQAQFYWFDKWFKRAPKVWELSGKSTKFPAPNRYLEYLKIKSSQHVPEKVQSVSRRAQISPQKLDKINEMRLAELQRSWGIDEEEVFIRFARPGIGYFDAAWLRKHPTYRRLRQEQKL